MAGYAPSLTTLAAVKTELNISTSTDDAFITTLIQNVSDYIARRCNRDFTFSATWVENVPAYAQTRLIVRHVPIVGNITSITFNSATIDSSIYSVQDANKGWIYCKTGWYWTANFFPSVSQDPFAGSENDLYQVTYAGGYVTPQQAVDNVGTRSLPYDLEDACVLGVVQRYRERGQNQRIAEESLLDYRVQYRQIETIPQVADAIRAYRRVGVGR